MVDARHLLVFLFAVLVLAAPATAGPGNQQGPPEDRGNGQGPPEEASGGSGPPDHARGPEESTQHRSSNAPVYPHTEPEDDGAQEEPQQAGSDTTEGSHGAEDGRTTDADSGGADDPPVQDPDAQAPSQGDADPAPTQQDPSSSQQEPTITQDPAQLPLVPDQSSATEDPAPMATPTGQPPAQAPTESPGPGDAQDVGPAERNLTPVVLPDRPSPMLPRLQDQPLSPASTSPVASTGQTRTGAQTTQNAWGLPILALFGLTVLAGAGLTRLRDPAAPPGARAHTSATRPSPIPAPADAQPAAAPEPPAARPPGARGALEIAHEAVQREDYEGAIGWFETAIALEPGLCVAHLCLGVCLTGLDRDEEALDALSGAYDLSPGDPVIVFQKARVLAKLERNQQAISHLTKLLDALPEMRETVLEDDAFSHLQDHPQFLAIAGQL